MTASAFLAVVPPNDALVMSLIDALAAERRQVEIIRDALTAQRDGVARDDAQTVDDSVFATQRALMTLQAARTHRRSVCKHLTGSADAPLGDLDAALGTRMTDVLRRERDALMAAAADLVRELGVNRRVLQEAITRGNALVQALVGAPEPHATYAAPDRSSPEQSVGGRLIDRRA